MQLTITFSDDAANCVVSLDANISENVDEMEPGKCTTLYLNINS